MNQPMRFPITVSSILAGIAVVLGLGVTTAASTISCTISPSSFRVVPISGSLRHIAIDPSCRYVYVSNASFNRIEVFSIVDDVLQAPIAVGSQPAGFDITPDGSRMYVANSGGNTISVVDLTLRQEVKQVPVPSDFSNDRPFSLAIANNGLAVFATTFAGSGFGARMMQLNLTTEAVSQRTDFWFGGTTTEATYVTASADKGTIAIIAGDISSAPVFIYTSSTNSFTSAKNLNGFVGYVATDGTGSTVLVNPGTFVLDSALNVLGTIPGAGFGVAINPSGTTGYRVVDGGIDVLDLDTLLKSGSLPFGDTVQGASSLFNIGIGELTVSADGNVLAVITDRGFSRVDVRVPPPPNYTLTAGTTGTGSGVVTSVPSGIGCPPTCSTTYDGGTMITLTATAVVGSGFTTWSGCDAVLDASCTVTMNASRTVIATFDLPKVLYDNGPLVNVSGGGFGGVDASRLQDVSLGMNVLGFGHQLGAGNAVADDFIVPEAGWTITQITLFAYQTGSSTNSTMNDVRLVILDGPPSDPRSITLVPISREGG